MLLSLSSRSEGLDADLTAVVAESDAATGVPDGSELRAFALAALDATDHADTTLETTRAALVDSIGSGGVADAAGVVAQFDALTRIADATGTQLDDFSEEAAPILLGDFDLAHLRTE